MSTKAWIIHQLRKQVYDVPAPQTIWQGPMGNSFLYGRIVAYYPVDQYGILVAKIDQPALKFEVSEDCGLDCGLSWMDFRSDAEFNGILLHALRSIVQERVVAGTVLTPTLIEEKTEAAPQEEAA